MASTVQHGDELCALAHIEGSYALRRVDLVTRNREQVASDVVYVHGHFTGGLHRVGMEVHIRLGSNLPNLFNWLKYTGLIVGHHDGHQPGIGTQGATHVIWIHEPTSVNWEVGHFTAIRLQMLTCVQDGVMFNGGGDHVIALPHQTENCQIVRLGTAT